jgi:hypothetical protein
MTHRFDRQGFPVLFDEAEDVCFRSEQNRMAFLTKNAPFSIVRVPSQVFVTV